MREWRERRGPLYFSLRIDTLMRQARSVQTHADSGYRHGLRRVPVCVGRRTMATCPDTPSHTAARLCSIRLAELLHERCDVIVVVGFVADILARHRGVWPTTIA